MFGRGICGVPSLAVAGSTGFGFSFFVVVLRNSVATLVIAFTVDQALFATHIVVHVEIAIVTNRIAVTMKLNQFAVRGSGFDL